ncbi:hypothetical protein LTR17_026519, partial [Elasticomyces elasticus]
FDTTTSLAENGTRYANSLTFADTNSTKDRLLEHSSSPLTIPNLGEKVDGLTIDHVRQE